MLFKLTAMIAGMAFGSLLLAWNYWAGAVALFANHPNYSQVYFTTLILCPFLLGGRKTLFTRVAQTLTAIALIAWVIRLTGIMSNAPF